MSQKPNQASKNYVNKVIKHRELPQCKSIFSIKKIINNPVRVKCSIQSVKCLFYTLYGSLTKIIFLMLRILLVNNSLLNVSRNINTVGTQTINGALLSLSTI